MPYFYFLPNYMNAHFLIGAEYKWGSHLKHHELCLRSCLLCLSSKGKCLNKGTCLAQAPRVLSSTLTDYHGVGAISSFAQGELKKNVFLCLGFFVIYDSLWSFSFSSTNNCCQRDISCWLSKNKNVSKGIFWSEVRDLDGKWT